MNPHTLRRGILSPLCLPISPSERWALLLQHFLKFEMSNFTVWRRRSESNRRKRLCRPRHNHFATPPGVLLIDEKTSSINIWSGIRDSNSRPIPWQGIALPTELIPHHVCYKFWSGIRDSNSRPIPWQGIALPTELIPHPCLHFI